MVSRIPLDNVCGKKIATLSSHYDGKIEYIDISSIDNAEKAISSTQIIDFNEAPSRAKQLVKKGDILVSMVRPNLNAVAVIKKESDYALVASTGYCVLRCNEEFNNHYVFYFCQSPYFIEDMVKQATGASYPAVSNSIVKSCLIPLRNLEEQRYIAAVLDRISNLISLRKQQLEKLDELVKARFVEIFGDPIINSKGWSSTVLGKLCDVGSSKRIFEKEYVTEGIPFYRTKEIVELSKGNRITTELFISEERFDEIKKEYGVPGKDDLLISAVGTIGVIWIVDGKSEFYFKDGNLLRIAASSAFNSVYMKYLLEQLIYNYKSKMSAGTAYAALTIAGLKEMQIYEVPLDMQEKFAQFYNEVEQSRLTIQQGLDKLEVLKKALMQEYFG